MAECRLQWHETTRGITTPPGWDASPSEGCPLGFVYSFVHWEKRDNQCYVNGDQQEDERLLSSFIGRVNISL